MTFFIFEPTQADVVMSVPLGAWPRQVLCHLAQWHSDTPNGVPNGTMSLAQWRTKQYKVKLCM